MLKRPTTTMWVDNTETMAFFASILVAFVLGVGIGWNWKPKWKWASFDKHKFCSTLLDLSPSSSPRLLGFCSPSFTLRSPRCSEANRVMDNDVDKTSSHLLPKEERCNNVVTEEDLKRFCQLVEVKDDEDSNWTQMMERVTPTMICQAWHRDPKTGPTQYRSITVYEDATPEIVREFLWDDEFRSRWDDMLTYSSTIEEQPTTGTMIVHWIRKYPFFYKDREYIIGRRIWESGRSYYCITKGVPFPYIPRRDKARRVNLFFSSWRIRAESRRHEGQLSACEVLFYHQEEMGIPKKIAKFGVRKGMWGAVQKVEPGLRAYQKERASGVPLSHPALMAHINTKIKPDYLRSFDCTNTDDHSLQETESKLSSNNKPLKARRKIPKLLILCTATIVLACTIDHGLVIKGVIFGVARRFENVGKRL